MRERRMDREGQKDRGKKKKIQRIYEEGGIKKERRGQRKKDEQGRREIGERKKEEQRWREREGS